MSDLGWIFLFVCVVILAIFALSAWRDWLDSNPRNPQIPPMRNPTEPDEPWPRHGSLEDCKTRFSPPPDFQGEPQIPVKRRRKRNPKKSYIPHD